MMYKDQWDDLTEKMGYWVDLKNPYITYNNDYIETVWWILNSSTKRVAVQRLHHSALFTVGWNGIEFTRIKPTGLL